MKFRNGEGMYEWQILRMVGQAAEVVGYVWADDEATAISMAIEKFGITGRAAQSLIAHQFK